MKIFVVCGTAGSDVIAGVVSLVLGKLPFTQIGAGSGYHCVEASFCVCYAFDLVFTVLKSENIKTETVKQGTMSRSHSLKQVLLI